MNNTKIMIFILFIIIAASMVGVWYFVNYKEFEIQYEDRMATIESLDKAIANAGQVEEDLKRKNTELAEVKEEFEKLKKKVQVRVDIPKLLKETEQASLDTKVKFNEIKIENLVPYEGYSEIPIELQIVGGYHDLGKYLRKLEYMKLFNVNAGTLQLQPFIGREGSNKVEINMTLNVKSFVLNDTGGL
ncbi:MAG TPA: type 4a pilus biogenesis protein PilO [Candidatus Wallbacteria bacterium]|nr:MAG: Pilus assembly protein, PilO [bacterium ADurb.Bin243]HOD39401.1 type 4a pilus biogenesis protein PilO [Candidatus Wallbacteria bacterium]HOT75156.1 type 4a pilus biogenesis protein PilO [Candidatus Wallbacteria bacterium]